MSARAGQKSQTSSSKTQATKKAEPAAPTAPAVREPIPMKPRKGLFVALMAVFFAWVGVLLAMYFTTVRRPDGTPPPERQSTTMTAMTEPARPESPAHPSPVAGRRP